MLLAALLTVSCAKEQQMAGDGAFESVHFSVATGIATRANSDFATGTGVDKLAVQAFIKDSQGAFQKTNANITVTPVEGASPLAWDVDMKLAKNREYKLAFFAYKNGTGIYNTADLSAVTVDYSKIAVNNDDADAFCAARYLQVSGSLTETVILYRPLAQINVGCSDLEEYMNSTIEEMQNLTIQVSANAVPDKLNIIGGDADDEGVVAAATSGSQSIDFGRVAVLDVDDELMAGYDYMSMVYVLADKDMENMTFTIDLDYGTEAAAHDKTDAAHISQLVVTNMPYQANYKTNIYGQMLTGNLHYDVEISPEFNTPDYEVSINEEYTVSTQSDGTLQITVSDDSEDALEAALTLAATMQENTVTLVLPQETELSDIANIQIDAIKEIVFSGDIVGEASVVAPYGNKCGLVQSGFDIDGNGNTLSVTGGGDTYAIMTSGGSISNITVAEGFRGVLVMSPTKDIIIDNVTSGPNVGYALNTAEAGDPDARIIATNSTFLGWCSWANIASASFTNCKFGQGTYYGDTSIYGRLFKPYVSTTFTDCEFGYNCADGDKEYLDLSALKANQTVKLINCKVGDTVITASNIKDLLDGWQEETNANYSYEDSIFDIVQFE